MTQGMRGFHPARRDWRERLAALRTGDERELPAALKAEVERECERLRLVIEMIGTVEGERDAATDHANAGKAAQLIRLSGIAETLGHGLVNEAFHRDFANRRQVGAYFGLASSPYNSGGMVRDQGISRAGNSRARYMAIELAWLWLRYQPESRLARWYRERVGDARGRIDAAHPLRAHRIMIVALARKLMVALWRYLTTGAVPEGATLKA